MKKARQERILYSLDKLGFLTRTHLQELHDLKSCRNTSRVMKDLGEYVLMKRHYERNGEAVYYLNQKGRELIGSEKEWKWSEHIEHHLMRNDMYLYCRQPSDWQVEQPVKFKVQERNGRGGLSYKEKVLIPDATFTKDSIYHFVEVDRKQTMKENKKKVQLYQELMDIMITQFGHKPVVLFYTHTLTRKQQLLDWCQAVHLPCLVYTKEDLH